MTIAIATSLGVTSTVPNKQEVETMRKVLLAVCVTCVLALLASPAQAQKWSPEELEVWKVITTLWELEKAGDQSWMDTLHESYRSWPYESAMPMSKEDTVRWVESERGQFKILVQHLAPIAIVVVDDTAVVHYYHSSVAEYDDAERETIDGRATDVLVRTGDGWRILSWVGDEIGEDDD
jgi:hypothetical protein